MKPRHKEYWDKNISRWGEFYLDVSHSEEEIQGSGWFTYAYKNIIMPIESSLMKQRYEKSTHFIDTYVKSSDMVADIGCGTGIFTVQMLNKGASVNAIDFSQSALDATRQLVERKVPQHKDRVSYHLLDLSQEPIPQSNVAFAMGVTPYISNIEDFYKNILPYTEVFYCLILDPTHWANRLRKYMPMLNVRSMNWFEKERIDQILKTHQWDLIERENFASGYLDTVQKSSDLA